MDPERWAVALAVVVVAVASVASGPLVAGVDLTGDPDLAELDPGNGSVTVTGVSVPGEGFRLERGGFGSGAYYLVSPPVRVDTGAVEGQPVLTYKIRIEELSYVGFRAYFLGEDVGEAGGIDVVIPRSSVSVPDGNATSYRGEVVVVVRGTDGKRVVHRENVTVGVVG